MLPTPRQGKAVHKSEITRAPTSNRWAQDSSLGYIVRDCRKCRKPRTSYGPEYTYFLGYSKVDCNTSIRKKMQFPSFQMSSVSSSSSHSWSWSPTRRIARLRSSHELAILEACTRLGQRPVYACVHVDDHSNSSHSNSGVRDDPLIRTLAAPSF